MNISTFTALLQLVIEELEHQQEHGATNSNTRKAVDRVTAVMHRVLPGIRHYSSWLLYSIESSISNLSQRQFPMGAKSNLQALWIAYTKALTAFMSSFTVSDLLDIEYLLEEDEDTIGFVPFRACKVQNRFIHDEKPKPYGHLVSRHHPTREMLARIKELLLDGLEIVNGEVYSHIYSHMRLTIADSAFRWHRFVLFAVVKAVDLASYMIHQSQSAQPQSSRLTLLEIRGVHGVGAA